MSGSELMNCIEHTYISSEPDGCRHRGQWYCENSDCVVREVVIRVKLHGAKMPKIMKCPVCGKGPMSFHHWLKDETLLLVPEKKD